MTTRQVNSFWTFAPFPIPKWWQRSIVLATIVSIVLHGLILIFKKPLTPISDKHLKTPIAVVIVNSQSRLAPVNPKKLAQQNLNGGGELDNPAEATAISQMLPGINDKIQNLQQEQNRLLSALKDDGSQSKKTSKGLATVEKDFTDPLEAELAKRIQMESEKPRKAIFTSTSAKSVVYAEYYNRIRNKVEAYGTKYFPRENGQPLYGSLIMLITINKDGRLMNPPKIEKSSGSAELDRQTIAIVQASSPFEKFSPAMVAQLDVIDWIASFEYVRGGAQPQLELKTNNHKQ
jgi:protein TonB